MREQAFNEEIANSATHSIGIVLSVAALIVLVALAGIKGNTWQVVSFSIYGSTLIALYLSSTLYHGFISPRIKRIFNWPIIRLFFCTLPAHTRPLRS